MPKATYWAVPCASCGGMIALDFVKFDTDQKAIGSTQKQPFEADCPLCHTRKSYAMYQAEVWEGPLPVPTFRPHPAFAEATANLYWIFHCRCAKPLVIQVDRLVPRGSGPEVRSREIHHVVAVCPDCKFAGIYSADKDSPHYDPQVRVVGGIQNATLDRAGWLECERGDQCPTPIALFLRANFPNELEAWRSEIAAWTWEDLHCPSGHQLRRPQKRP
jgi:hypothetical protein